MKILSIAIIVINLFYPSFETFNHAYQDYLLTSGERFLESKDIQFQIGPDIEGFKEWRRVRLGFPDQPIVIDMQFESRILQARIITKDFLLNMIPTFIIILLWTTKRLRKRKKLNYR